MIVFPWKSVSFCRDACFYRGTVWTWQSRSFFRHVFSLQFSLDALWAIGCTISLGKFSLCDVFPEAAARDTSPISIVLYCINVGRTHLKKYGNKYSLRAYHSNEGACGLTPFPVWLFPTLHTCAGGIHRLKTPQPQRSGGNVSVGGFSGSNCVSM